MNKLEKNFLLEKRYENDKRDMKIVLWISIIIPIYLIPYFILNYVWKKYYLEIRQMRDEQREIELLQLIESKKYKNKKYIYAYYALADLGNQQIKVLLVSKIIALDEKKHNSGRITELSMEYGRVLAYLVQEENDSSW